ncbi:MAG: hypothetical protein C5B51_02255, partial [Terriglobia bacterium]
MAARLHPAPSPAEELLDLRRLSARDLEPLLQEEIATWRDELEWDFEKSADLVRRFVELRALNGSALLRDGQVIGYVYYVLEENKGLVGDLYIRRAFRSIEREHILLEAALAPAVDSAHVSRIECQLMMLDPAPGRSLPLAQYVSGFERNFMRVDLRRA